MRMLLTLAIISLSLAASDISLMRVPDGGVQPQIAVGGDGVVHLIYTKGDGKKGDVLYSNSKDGVSFSKPVKVNSQVEATIIGNIRGAQLALGKQNRVHIAWNGTDGMYYTHSNDSGGFEPERNVSQIAKEMDGGGSVAADSIGNVYVIWHATGGEKGEGKRRVWVARSTDDGKSFAKEAPAWNQPTGACGCCNLKAYADSKGTVYVLYRAATEMVNRDVYLIQSKDNGKTFTGGKVSAWKGSTCPMSTMYMNETSSGMVGTWETNSQIYFSSFGAQISNPLMAPGIGKGRKYSVVVSNKAGESLLAWTEGMAWERGGALVWQTFDKNGKLSKESGRKDGVPTWSLVAAFAKEDGTFVIVY